MPTPVSGSHSAATLPPEDQFQPPPVQSQTVQNHYDDPHPAEYVAKPPASNRINSPAPAPAPAPKPAAPPPNPTADAAAATTPQQAYNAIKTIPVPNNADMAFLSPVIQTAMMDGRASAFNQTRIDAAEAALANLRPERSDFAGLPAGTVEALYQTATAKFESDPYARELSRIVDEARANPQSIPAYLVRGESTANVEAIPQNQLSGILNRLGVAVPNVTSPEFASHAYQLLGALPDFALAAVINPGMQVSYAGGPSVAGHHLMGPNVSVTAKVEGKVELSDAETGIDFVQTQQFKMSVEARAEVQLGYDQSRAQKALGLVDKFDRLPESVKGWFDRSPVLGTLIKGLPFSVSGSSYQGHRLSYEAVVPPEIGDLISAGDTAAAPNPLDPLAMPKGSSVLMRGQELKGNELEFAIQSFKGGFAVNHLEGAGFGVTRLEGAMVEVYSGSMDAVEIAAHYGHTSLPISVSVDNSLETRELQVARIDLSTAEGREAYQFFMRTGIVPEWAPPGVPKSGSRDAFAGERATSLQLKAGGLEVGLSSSSNGYQAETAYADGARDYVSTYSSSEGTVSEVKLQLNASGDSDYQTATWVIMRPDVNPASASLYAEATRLDMSDTLIDGSQDIQTTYTTAELFQLRQQARNWVMAEKGQDRLQQLEDGEFPNRAHPLEALAVAEGPHEIFNVLRSDDHALELIQDMYAMSTDVDVPGTVRMQDSQ